MVSMIGMTMVSTTNLRRKAGIQDPPRIDEVVQSYEPVRTEESRKSETLYI